MCYSFILLLCFTSYPHRSNYHASYAYSIKSMQDPTLGYWFSPWSKVMCEASVISVYYWLANGYAISICFPYPLHFITLVPWNFIGTSVLRDTWGFRHIRKVRFNRRWSLECLTIYPSFFTPIAIAYIHPSIHSFISYCNICIKLHCIALERGAKSARAKDGAVLS
jgi:hypothetical protein